MQSHLYLNFLKNKVNNYKKFQKNNLKTNGFVHFKLKKTKIIFDFKENIKAKKSRLDIFFNNLKISRATKILPNNDLDIFLKINNKNYKIKNPMSENIIYNHNKLLKNDKLLFDYNVNSNIILLVKKFLLDEK